MNLFNERIEKAHTELSFKKEEIRERSVPKTTWVVAVEEKPLDCVTNRSVVGGFFEPPSGSYRRDENEHC